MQATFDVIQGGVTAAKGFAAAGAHVGLRRKRKDLALLVSQEPCHFAAVFTTSTAKGAPILWNQEVVERGGKVQAVVVNSANANSCTGYPGFLHARQMAETTASCLGLAAHDVLVASTGIIGMPLPIEQVKAGIKQTAPLLGISLENGSNAAEAITTTDSFIKQMAVQFEIGGSVVTMGAMAKGSGMVHPNMATMLSFITTDLAIAPALLRKALKESVDSTYNMISVDGDTSTNDMVVILSNGLARNETICQEGAEYELFVAVLNHINTTLAKYIASDGEGATKLIEVTVHGAETVEAARKLARHVVASNLVKTAFFAQDPNWGRIIAAMGSSCVPFNPETLDVTMGGGGAEVGLLLDGTPFWLDEDECMSVLKSDEIAVEIDLNMGDCSATSWGCDLGYEYIRKNGNYRATYKAEFAAAKEGAA